MSDAASIIAPVAGDSIAPSAVGQAYVLLADESLSIVASSQAVDHDALLRVPGIAELLRAPLPPGKASLALLEHGSARYLVHRSALVAHVLAGLPDRVGPREAINTWSSHFWRSGAPQHEPLPRVALPLPGGRWAAADVTEFLADSSHQRLVRFIIDALLTTPTEKTIAIACDTEDLAAAIACVALMLPERLVERLTFATALARPVEQVARVIGVSRGGLHSSEGFGGSFIGFDPATGEATPVTATALAHDATAAVAYGDWDAVRSLGNLCAQLNVRTAGALLAIHAAVTQPTSLTARDISAFAVDAEVGKWFSRQPDVLKRVVDAVLDEPRAVGVIDIVLDQCERASDASEIMVSPSLDRAIQALTAGDEKTLLFLLSEVFPRISPMVARRFASAALAREAPARMTAKTRATLLPMLFAVSQAPGDGFIDARLLPWLVSEPQELWSLLGMDRLPDAGKIAACRLAIVRDQGIALSAATVLAREPALFIRVLGSLSQSEGELCGAGNAFHAVIAAKGGKPVLSALLDPRNSFAPELIDRCLLPLLSQDRLKAMDLVMDYHPTLARQLGATQTLSEILGRMMSEGRIDRQGRQVKRILQRFVRSVASDRGVLPDTAQRAATYLLLRQFARSGNPRYDTMLHLAENASACNDQRLAGATVATVLDRTAHCLLRSRRYRHVDRARLAVEGTVIALCHMPGTQAALIYRELLSRIIRRKRFWKSHGVVCAMMEIACGQGLALPVARHDLKQPRHELAEQIARHSKLFDFVDHRATLWQEEPLKLWRALKKTYPPSWGHKMVQSTMALVRIAAIAIAAAGLALLVNAILHRQ